MIAKTDLIKYSIENANSLEEKINSKKELIDILRTADATTTLLDNIDSIMNLAPRSLLEVNDDFEKKHGFARDKFSHTKKTLEILNTEGLSTTDAFVARISMLLHDCEPVKVINDLCEFVKQDVITNEEAVAIMQQVWWHDLLGVDVNKGKKFTNQLVDVISDKKSLEINLRIFEADIRSYEFDDEYLEVIKNARELIDKKFATELENQVLVATAIESDSRLSVPSDEDVYIHGIYRRNNQQRSSEITPPVLLNLLVGNSIKSTSLVTMLESGKTSKNPTDHKATDNALNVFRFQQGDFPNEIASFGQQPDNWLTLVFFGRDVKNDVAVQPLATAEDVPYVAGLVNRFDSGKAIGCELPLDHAFFIIKTEGVGSLVPLVKLQALRLGQDPESYINSHVIIQGEGDEIEDLTTKLNSGDTHIREHNSKRIIDGLGYSGYFSKSVLMDHFDTVPPSIEKECAIINADNTKIKVFLDSLRDRSEAFPWLVDTEFFKELYQRLTEDINTRKEIIDKVNEGEGHYFDNEESVLYVRGKYGSVVSISDVKSLEFVDKNYGVGFGQGSKEFSMNFKNGDLIKLIKSNLQLD